jgi:LysM repeat protein
VRRRSPARLLAPLALVVTAVALFVVITSGTKSGSGGGTQATATATPKTSTKAKAKSKAAPKTYTVKPGDTPSAIAARLKIGVGELLDANPKADPNNLHPGQKLTIP